MGIGHVKSSQYLVRETNNDEMLRLFLNISCGAAISRDADKRIRIALQSVIRRVIWRSGGAESRPVCGAAARSEWVLARIDCLPRERPIGTIKVCAGSGFVTKTGGRIARSAGLRMSGHAERGRLSP